MSGRRGAPRTVGAALLWKVQSAAAPQRPGSIDPAGENNPDFAPHGPQKLDEFAAGASQFGFFDEPEPVMAGDLSFRGVVTRTDYMKLAAIHFSTLDAHGLGYLTLDRLPLTPIQKRLLKAHRRR